MMMRTVKKYVLQAGLVLFLGIAVALFSLTLLPANKLGSEVEEMVELPLKDNDQTRSVSPESLVLSAVKAIIHALLPSS